VKYWKTIVLLFIFPFLLFGSDKTTLYVDCSKKWCQIVDENWKYVPWYANRIAYNYNDLDSWYSKEDFDTKFWPFVTSLENKLISEKRESFEIDMILQSIISDLESWNKEWVKLYLSDQWLDNKIIDGLIKYIKTTWSVDSEVIDNLWNVDFDKAVDEYIKTWKIPKWYEFFKIFFDEIWVIVKDKQAIIERWNEADEMLKIIYEIKEKMKNVFLVPIRPRWECIMNL